jgi:DNA topoisomerase I
MSIQYCLDINNPKKKKFDIEELEQYVYELYAKHFNQGEEDEIEDDGKKKRRKRLDYDIRERENFNAIYVENDNSVCLVVSNRKKLLEEIDEITEKLSEDELVFQGIKLSKPKIFGTQALKFEELDIEEGKKKGPKWKSLKHNGPYFTHILEPYIPEGLTIKYDKKDYKLSAEEEKIALFYARRIITDETAVIQYTKDIMFNSNFWNDFKEYLTTEHKKIFKDFTKFDWTKLVNRVKEIKEERKNKSSEQKRKENALKEKKKRKYGYGYIDNQLERLGNFIAEPASIFLGRGNNKLRGKIKKELEPEDFTINIGKNDAVPKPPKGRNWGDVVHDNDAVWIAKWRDPITDRIKYIFFAAEGKFKGQSDVLKYEKARKLNKHIDTIRQQYTDDAKSSNNIKKQLGTVLYLIDHFGIRVGNEKGEDEADTVGASTLEVGHIQLIPPNKILFDFLGKDSIRFYKELEVPKYIYENMKEFISNKKDNNQVFNLISSNDINNYLKSFDKMFSAKVFRTRLASTIIYDALKNLEIPEETSDANAKTLFKKVNAKVADVLNHTRNVSAKAQEKIDEIEEEIKEEQKNLKKEKDTKVKEKLKKKLEKLQTKLEKINDTKSVAVTTSLNNYIDPRVVVSWTINQNVEPTIAYTTKTLQKKFNWAIENTDAEWDYNDTELLINPDLEPETKDEKVTHEKIPSEKKSKKEKKVTFEEDKEIYENLDNIQIKNYSDKTFVVIGDTQKYEEKFKEIKGIYTLNLKDLEGNKFSGWLFPNSKKKIVEKIINELEKNIIYDYNLLLKICKNPDKYNSELTNLSKEVILWLDNVSKYAKSKNIKHKLLSYL